MDARPDWGVIAATTLHGVEVTVRRDDADRRGPEPLPVIDWEFRRRGEAWPHTGASWWEETRRPVPAAIAAWVTAHGVTPDRIPAPPHTHQAAARFDALVSGRTARVIDVVDLRPYDVDSGRRLAAAATTLASCARCQRDHAIVWTVAVDGLGDFGVGSGCAQRALGRIAPESWRVHAAQREAAIRPFLPLAAAWLATGADPDGPRDDRSAGQFLVDRGVLPSANLEAWCAHAAHADASSPIPRPAVHALRTITALRSAATYQSEGRDAWLARFTRPGHCPDVSLTAGPHDLDTIPRHTTPIPS